MHEASFAAEDATDESSVDVDGEYKESILGFMQRRNSESQPASESKPAGSENTAGSDSLCLKKSCDQHLTQTPNRTGNDQLLLDCCKKMGITVSTDDAKLALFECKGDIVEAQKQLYIHNQQLCQDREITKYTNMFNNGIA